MVSSTEDSSDPRFKKKCGMTTLNLSEVSTPEGVSRDGSDKSFNGSENSLDFESKRKGKNYETYLVRLRNAPVHKRVKNKYDSYLTKTGMKAIEFAENKKRWQKVIDSDLYSKTAGRGVPTL